MKNEKGEDRGAGPNVRFYAPAEDGEKPAKQPKPFEFVVTDLVVRATGTFTPPPDRG